MNEPYERANGEPMPILEDAEVESEASASDPVAAALGYAILFAVLGGVAMIFTI